MVHLAQKSVKEPSPFLRAKVDEVRVGRRNHNHRQKADVVRKPLVGLVVAFKSLPLAASAIHSKPYFAHRSVIHIIIAGHGSALFTVTDAERVLEIEETLGHGKAVHGIQKVGLAASVGPGNTVDAGGKFQVRLGDVLEIRYENPA